MHVGVHKPVVDPKRPATHGPVQLVLLIPYVAPYRPAAHGVHVGAVDKLYWPSGQIADVLFVDPAGQ